MYYLLLIFCLFSFSWISAQDHKPLLKKEEKFMRSMFPEGAQAEELSIPVLDSSFKGYLRADDRIRVVRQQDHVLGYLLSTRALGRYDYFDYLVAFAPDLSVLGLKVTAYRSTHGAAICQKKWLSQFTGYSGDDLSLGKEVDAISGATISASSMVKDVKRCYWIMFRLKDSEMLP